jgi:hypothetical protein
VDGPGRRRPKEDENFWLEGEGRGQTVMEENCWRDQDPPKVVESIEEEEEEEDEEERSPITHFDKTDFAGMNNVFFWNVKFSFSLVLNE